MTDKADKSGEFDRIDRLWKPLAWHEAALGLTDDAAILPAPPLGKQFVIAKDTMVAGTHFFPDDPLDLVARKLLRVNLSDMAAMGAAPWGWLSALALPKDFSDHDLGLLQEGFAGEQDEHGLTLLGGDTTSTSGPLVLSCTMLGLVDDGKAVTRSGAGAGDLIVVSGPIGDAFLGLQYRLGRLPDLDQADGLALETAYLLPEPQMALATRLPGFATACADISDGLLQDIGHIARASGLAADIYEADCPCSRVAQDLLAQQAVDAGSLLSGGDDYQLVFTIPAAKRDALTFLEKSLEQKLSVIGEMIKDVPGRVRLLDGQGQDITPTKSGWQHS